MSVVLNGRTVETDEQGFLLDFEDWSEESSRLRRRVTGSCCTTNPGA